MKINIPVFPCPSSEVPESYSTDFWSFHLPQKAVSGDAWYGGPHEPGSLLRSPGQSARLSRTLQKNNPLKFFCNFSLYP